MPQDIDQGLTFKDISFVARREAQKEMRLYPYHGGRGPIAPIETIAPLSAAHESPTPTLTADSADRKRIPLARGVLDYFPAALAAVAELSYWGNEKHNPGEDLHHSRAKSSDHADCIARHLVDRGTTYSEVVNGQAVILRHSTALAWRALCLLQEELEAQEGAPKPRGAR